MIKLFLDDVRDPVDCSRYMHFRIGALNPIYLENWVIVRNYQEFENALSMYAGNISHVSFDHDLADVHYLMDHKSREEIDLENEKTGYHCAKLLKDLYEIYYYQLPRIIVHSMNPVGAERIESLFKDIAR